MSHLQGTIRENLDPARRFSDRALISLCRGIRLWDILAGLSLSRTKRRAASPLAVPQLLGAGASGAAHGSLRCHARLS